MPRYILGYMLLLVGAGTIPAAAQEQEEGRAPWYCGADDIRWIETAAGPQKVAVIEPSGVEVPTELVLFLHGDSPRGDPTYQYRIAEGIARDRSSAVVAAPLRPGYGDDCGHRSGGDRGEMMGDNYSGPVVEALADQVAALREEFPVERSVLIGHSGGAALTALVASRHPELVDRGVLVACPCDLDAWRENMFDLTGVAAWELPLGGLSPLDEVDRLKPGQRLDVLVGSEDRVAPAHLSRIFAETARGAGAEVSFTVVEGADHEVIPRDLILRLLDAR